MTENSGDNVEAEYAKVVSAFAGDNRVTPPGHGVGFGKSALKVDGKIFAMVSSRNEFVVKLPAGRVNELIENKSGTRFDPGDGRLMKEWLVVKAKESRWLDLAQEAYNFVGN